MATIYNVVCLTARHSIAGDLVLQDQRLSDFLNDRRDTAFTLSNTRIARLSDPSRVLEQHAESVVPKAWVVVAFEPPQKAIPQGKRLFGYVQKQRYQVYLILEGMEVRGTLHTPGGLDLRRLLATSGDGFLPITQAVVNLYDNDKYIIEQDAIMVNSRLVRYVGAMPEPKS